MSQTKLHNYVLFFEPVKNFTIFRNHYLRNSLIQAIVWTISFELKRTAKVMGEKAGNMSIVRWICY